MEVVASERVVSLSALLRGPSTACKSAEERFL